MTPHAGRAPRSLWAAIAAVTALAVASRIPLLVGGSRDYDEGVYWLSVRRLVHGDALFGSIYSSQPPLFLPLLAPFFRTLGGGLTSLRVATVALFAVGVLAGTWAAWRLGGRAAAVVAAALLCLDPLLLLTSTTVLAEGPALALALVAVALSAEVAAGPARRPAATLALCALAGTAAAAAIGVKLLAVAAVVPVVILLSAPMASGVGGRQRLAAAGGGGALVAAAVAVALHGQLGGLVSQSVGLHLDSRTVDEGGFTVDFRTAVWRELPIAALAALGACRALIAPASRLAGVALSGWALTAVAAVALQHPLWPHHLSAVAPPLAVLGGMAVAPPRWRARRLGAGLGVVGAGALVAFFTGYVALRGASSDANPNVVAAIEANVPPGALIVSDDPLAVAQAGRDVPPELVDTSLVRVLSGNLTAATVEGVIVRDHVAAVYFGTSRLQHLAGFEDWVAQHFPVVVRVSSGSTLYLPATAS